MTREQIAGLTLGIGVGTLMGFFLRGKGVKRRDGVSAKDSRTPKPTAAAPFERIPGEGRNLSPLVEENHRSLAI